MARTLFFCKIFRKFSEINCYWPNFNQYNIFYHYKYFFFQSVFWSLFNHHQRSQSNQEQCSLCWSSPCFLVLFCTHCVWLQCFSTFLKIKRKQSFTAHYFQTTLFLATMFKASWPTMKITGCNILLNLLL